MSSRTTNGIQQVSERIKLTFDRSKGLYKKCIGRRRGSDGISRPRIFWLGDNQVVAMQKALILREVWDGIETRKGEQVWDDWSEQYCEEEFKKRTTNARILAGYAEKLVADLGVFAPVCVASSPQA